MQNSIERDHLQEILTGKIPPEITDLLQSSSIGLHALEKKAAELSWVLEVIIGISEQINLLAINAILEADRAEKSGARFSVVANELNLQAKQTVIATDEIRDKIVSIQDLGRRSAADLAQLTSCLKEMKICSATQISDIGNINANQMGRRKRKN